MNRLRLGLALALQVVCAASIAGLAPSCSSSSSSTTPTPDAAGGDDASGGDDMTDDASTTADAPDDAFHPAPHEPFPQVPNLGGPRIKNPAFVTVTFMGDTRHTEFEAYATWVATSNWLKTVGMEYGLGAGSVAGAVQLAETPPATLTSAAIEDRLATGIKDGTIPKPSTTLADAIYLVYYPSATSITATFVNGITAVSCTDFIAFHGEAHAQGLDFSYAVMPDCRATDTGLNANEFIEQAASHEIIEAATDAFPITHPAYQLRPDPTDPWFSTFRFEVEVGDMCEVPAFTWRENGHVAQRSWSNAAAAAGGDPCVPIDSTTLPYFNTTATPNVVQHVAPGASVQFEIKGWSTAPVADWAISPRLTGTLAVKASLDKLQMNNGKTSTLTVTVPANAVAGTSTGIYLLSSHSATDYHAWQLFIVTP